MHILRLVMQQAARVSLVGDVYEDRALASALKRGIEVKKPLARGNMPKGCMVQGLRMMRHHQQCVESGTEDDETPQNSVLVQRDHGEAPGKSPYPLSLHKHRSTSETTGPPSAVRRFIERTQLTPHLLRPRQN